MKIGILECGPTPPEIAAEHGDYPRMMTRLFDGRGWTFEAFAAMDLHFPDGPDAADGWILTGSRYGAFEHRAFIRPLEAFIRSCADTHRPMIGICFGHQVIAQAMGGHVERAAHGWTLGRQVYGFAALGQTALTAWHQDVVTEAPDGARIAATHPDCPIAALDYPGWAASVQAHPEFDAAVTAAFLDLRRNDPALPTDRLAAAKAALNAPLDRLKVAEWLARPLTLRSSDAGSRRTPHTENRPGA